LLADGGFLLPSVIKYGHFFDVERHAVRALPDTAIDLVVGT